MRGTLLCVVSWNYTVCAVPCCACVCVWVFWLCSFVCIDLSMSSMAIVAPGLTRPLLGVMASTVLRGLSVFEGIIQRDYSTLAHELY